MGLIERQGGNKRKQPARAVQERAMMGLNAGMARACMRLGMTRGVGLLNLRVCGISLNRLTKGRRPLSQKLPHQPYDSSYRFSGHIMMIIIAVQSAKIPLHMSLMYPVYRTRSAVLFNLTSCLSTLYIIRGVH